MKFAFLFKKFAFGVTETAVSFTIFAFSLKKLANLFRKIVKRIREFAYFFL